jgi:hypothetical protein
MANLSKRDRDDLLKREARLRKTGQWGDWETLRFARPADFGNIGVFRKAHKCAVFSVLDRMDFSGARHLAVASLSGIRPTFHEMQRIKNEIAGKDATAVEVYPPQPEMVDGADMYHLWVLPGPLPFSLSRTARANADPR